MKYVLHNNIIIRLYPFRNGTLFGILQWSVIRVISDQRLGPHPAPLPACRSDLGLVYSEQFPHNTSMSLAERAKIDVPAIEMVNEKLQNGYHSTDHRNGVEEETEAGGLSTQEIMTLREKHIGWVYKWIVSVCSKKLEWSNIRAIWVCFGRGI